MQPPFCPQLPQQQQRQLISGAVRELPAERSEIDGSIDFLGNPSSPSGCSAGLGEGGGTGCSNSSPILRDSRGHAGQTHVALPAALFPVPCGEDTAVLMEAPPFPSCSVASVSQGYVSCNLRGGGTSGGDEAVPRVASHCAPRHGLHACHAVGTAPGGDGVHRGHHMGTAEQTPKAPWQ